MRDSSRRWIDAGIQLAKNPEDKVSCPECGRSDLTVKDINSGEDPTQFERYLTCDACGSFNVLRLNHK